MKRSQPRETLLSLYKFFNRNVLKRKRVCLSMVITGELDRDQANFTVISIKCCVYTRDNLRKEEMALQDSHNASVF